MSQKEDLRNVRGRRKASITKFINSISRYIAEDDLERVKEYTEKLKETFKEFESIHERIHATLETDEQLEESDQYFDKVQEEYVAALTRTKGLIRATSIEKKEQGLSFNSEVLQAMNLPKIELEPYSGDPMKYHTFINMFEEVVEKVVKDEKIRLTRLMQYTTGLAREAIGFCTLAEDGAGYRQARDILYKRFGNKYLITEHILTSLRQGKPIRSPQALQQFSDHLSSCHMTLNQLGKLQEIDSQACMLEIVNRFQPYLQLKWKNKAMDIKRVSDRYPTFGELVSFVREAAEDANDPVFGKLGGKSSSENKPYHPTSQVRSSQAFSSNVSESPQKWIRPPCVVCGGDHKLLYCTSFKKMKPGERLKLVTDHKLCENCFLNNHSTANCRKPPMCGIPGCSKKHSKFIHVYSNSSGSVATAAAESVSNQVVNANTNTGCEVHLPIVNVNVNNKYVTGALLDTASSSTFCSHRLVRLLGLQGYITTYMLNTVSDAKQMSSQVVNLCVSSLDGKECLKLCNVYVVDDIPAKSTPVNARKFPHLEGLPLAKAKHEVDILIGQDNAEALIPLDVRRGQIHEPFAVRTLFGWSINGPASGIAPVSRNVISHFISATSLEDKVDSLWKLENEGLTGDDSA